MVESLSGFAVGSYRKKETTIGVAPSYEQKPLALGDYTVLLYGQYENQGSLPVQTAYSELVSEVVPFNERLSAFVSQRFGIPDEVSEVRKALKTASAEKDLGFSSSNLSQWLTADKREVCISKQTIFKLCLAMELDLDESRNFIYDCLYQNWFNYRVPEELVYCFFIGNQKLFGNEAYSQATGFITRFNKMYMNKSLDEIPEYSDATGYTRMLGNGLVRLLENKYGGPAEAVLSLSNYMGESYHLLHGIQRSGIHTYNLYFKQGGIGIKPLCAMYQEDTGLTLPETSYLDMTDPGVDFKRKRLLWGTLNRNAWIAKNGPDWDILNESEIKLEHHAVEKMLHTGISRGNMLALLFFHFCLEYKDGIKDEAKKPALFEHFYEFANATLDDECGMMPLHPRRPFDRLLLLSIAQSGNKSPIDYLNELLSRYYAI